MPCPTCGELMSSYGEPKTWVHVCDQCGTRIVQWQDDGSWTSKTTVPALVTAVQAADDKFGEQLKYFDGFDAKWIAVRRCAGIGREKETGNG